ncbi:MAG: CHASE2 domain-containing protein [Desulfococcaceae bacterium]
MRIKINRKQWVRGLFFAGIILLACLAAEFGVRSGWLRSYENAYYDLWHRLAWHRAVPEHTLIVSIDSRTLAEHQDEPMVFWGPHFARAIQVLRGAGAAAIGIDFLFSVSIESWLARLDTPGSDLSRTYDIPFREQLHAGDVVLIATAIEGEDGQSDVLMPIPDLVYSLPNGLADIGLSNLYMDEDGVIRRFMPRLSDNGPFGLTLAAIMARRAAESPDLRSGIEADLQARSPIPIGFVGPPGAIPRVSFHRLIQPNAEKDSDLKRLVRDRAVIISAEYAGTNDIHLTPYVPKIITQGKSLMTGAEIHANIVETLLSGRHPRVLPEPIRLGWLVVLTGLGGFFFFRLKAVRGLVVLAFLFFLCAAVSYLLFLQGRILPTLNTQLALGVTFVAALGFRLTSEEKRRSRIEQAIRPYVSDAIVDKVVASDQLPDLGGETVRVTVLFSDIRQFTTISEQLDAHEVVEMLNRYYTLACEPILGQGGMVDKFIGDAVMAVFGAPLPLSDHERRAVTAACAMKQIAGEFGSWLHQRFEDRNLPDFRIGVGLHSGEAVIGNIGSAKRMEYTAIGDTVNVASRLESLCKTLGWTITASRQVTDQAGPGIEIGRCDLVTPTGRQGEIEVVEVLDMT